MGSVGKRRAEEGEGAAHSWNSVILRSESLFVSARWNRSVYMARRSSLAGSSGAARMPQAWRAEQKTRGHGQVEEGDQKSRGHGQGED